MHTTRFAVCLLVPVVVFTGALAAPGESSTIPAGAEVELELLHHLNSKYCPVGTEVFLRVSEDFVQDGRVLIREGTPVTGTIREAAKSKAMGRAGSMNISVKRLQAVDGTLIPLEAEISSQGRKRTGATVGMVFAFGLPGLFSKGRMAYAEKGTVYSASVSIDREIDPTSFDEKIRPPEVEEADYEAKITNLSPDVTLAIEKGKKLDPMRFRIRAPEGFDLADLDLLSLALVQVDELVLPDPVAVSEVSGASVVFEPWSVMQYCDAGDATLHFRGNLRDGSSFGATSRIRMTIKKKVKKA
jgi:hypothetical protein